ncbi:Zinc finger, CCHC-type [Trema orientale]|uniref:Zinc finger, CCHC-type n=1 Tax=Trema orientale TaxID=63057 RepID=A0A2P5D2V5_TREOI|nr:Zinc finger, CCHC-type [Trema orientale]
MEAPPFKVQRGRPKKLRRKEPDKNQPQSTTTKLKKTYVVIRCSNCGQARHNIKTCPYPRKEKAPAYVPIVGQTNTLNEPAEGPIPVATASNSRQKLNVKRKKKATGGTVDGCF